MNPAFVWFCIAVFAIAGLVFSEWDRWRARVIERHVKQACCWHCGVRAAHAAGDITRREMRKATDGVWHRSTPDLSRARGGRRV